jgi:hypothetical protein
MLENRVRHGRLKAGVVPESRRSGERREAMKYRHYKGGIYDIVCEAKLEADPDIVMMIYKSEEGLIWARPKEVFFEQVQHEGKTVPRFAPV